MKKTFLSVLVTTFALQAAHAGDHLAMLPVGSETHRHIEVQFHQLNNDDLIKGQKPSQKLSFVMPTKPPGNAISFVMPTKPPGNAICFVMPHQTAWQQHLLRDAHQAARQRDLRDAH